MKKLLQSKIFIGLVCFTLGFLMNHFLTKVQYHSKEITNTPEDRFSVNPDDFDHDKMLDAMNRMEKNMEKDMMKGHTFGMNMSGVERREDDQFVYYEIALNQNEKDHELKVSVKDGMISIKEQSAHSESERQFSIDPNLDDTKADVQTLKDKISIKIPKRR